MSDKVIPERHRIQYECMVGGGFTTPSPEYAKRLIEELGNAEATAAFTNNMFLAMQEKYFAAEAALKWISVNSHCPASQKRAQAALGGIVR